MCKILKQLLTIIVCFISIQMIVTPVKCECSVYRRLENGDCYYPLLRYGKPVLSKILILEAEIVIETEVDGTWREGSEYRGYFVFRLGWFNGSLLPDGITATITSPFDGEVNQTITPPYGTGTVEFNYRFNASEVTYTGEMLFSSHLTFKNGTDSPYNKWVHQMSHPYTIYDVIEFVPIYVPIVPEETPILNQQVEELQTCLENLNGLNKQIVASIEVVRVLLLALFTTVASLLVVLLFWILRPTRASQKRNEST